MFLPIPLELKRPGRTGPGTVPVANAVLVMLNVLVFWLGWSGAWAVGPDTGWLSVLTYGFAHANVLHLVGNMWALLVFGNPANRRIGNLYYVLAYVGTILVIGLLGRALAGGYMVGASGAIFAVIVIALVLIPTSKLVVGYLALFPITLIVALLKKPEHWLEMFFRVGRFSIPALWCLVVIPLLELWSFLWSGWSVANLAHLLGMICGLAVVLMLPARVTLGRRAAAASL